MNNIGRNKNFVKIVICRRNESLAMVEQRISY